MNTSDEYRLTRWGIPGWIAILSFVSFVALDIFLSPQDITIPLSESVATLFSSTTSMPAAVAALLAAAIGVPLGFCIYQAYFFLRWNSPFSRDGLLPPLIVGRTEDLDRTLRDIGADELVKGEDWRQNWVEHNMYELDHGWRWRYIENLFTEEAQRIDSEFLGLSIFSRHRVLLDLMHTLGASLAGIYLGFLIYLLMKVKIQLLSFSEHFLFTVGFLVVMIIALDREDHCRKAREKPYVQSSEDTPKVAPYINLFGLWVSYPAVIYLAFLGFALFFSSPFPILSSLPSVDLFFKIILALVAISAWYWARRNQQKRIIRSEMFLLLMALIISVWLAFQFHKPDNPFDWPYFWGSYLFLCVNIILLKNRQNVRDDLISLEYYTLRRAFTNNHEVTHKSASKMKDAKSLAGAADVGN